MTEMVKYVCDSCGGEQKTNVPELPSTWSEVFVTVDPQGKDPMQGAKLHLCGNKLTCSYGDRPTAITETLRQALDSRPKAVEATISLGTARGAVDILLHNIDAFPSIIELRNAISHLRQLGLASL